MMWWWYFIKYQLLGIEGTEKTTNKYILVKMKFIVHDYLGTRRTQSQHLHRFQWNIELYSYLAHSIYIYSILKVKSSNGERWKKSLVCFDGWSTRFVTERYNILVQ